MYKHAVINIYVNICQMRKKSELIHVFCYLEGIILGVQHDEVESSTLEHGFYS